MPLFAEYGFERSADLGIELERHCFEVDFVNPVSLDISDSATRSALRLKADPSYHYPILTFTIKLGRYEPENSHFSGMVIRSSFGWPR